MRVTLKPGAWVDPSKMTTAIRDAGFTPVPEEVHLTVTGILEAREGRMILALAGMTAPREITCVAAPGHDASPPALEGHVGQSVEIKGRWRFEGTGVLEVESVAPVP